VQRNKKNYMDFIDERVSAPRAIARICHVHEFLRKCGDSPAGANITSKSKMDLLN
jgi:hypothetical protein